MMFAAKTLALTAAANPSLGHAAGPTSPTRRAALTRRCPLRWF